METSIFLVILVLLLANIGVNIAILVQDTDQKNNNPSPSMPYTPSPSMPYTPGPSPSMPYTPSPSMPYSNTYRNYGNNPPGGNINCPSPDCKQGDGYCFCMYGCYDQKGNRNILLKGDCSRGIPFDPDQTCKVFGPDLVAGSPFEGGVYQGYTNQDIVASCLKNQ